MNQRLPMPVDATAPSTPQLYTVSQSVAAAAASEPASAAAVPDYVCNHPGAPAAMVQFMLELSAHKHMLQLRSEIGQKKGFMNEREAKNRDRTQEQRGTTASNSSITFGLQEYHAPACARQAGLDHEAEQARQKQETAAHAQDQLVSFATRFFTIKNAMAQKAADADKSFITGL